MITEPTSPERMRELAQTIDSMMTEGDLCHGVTEDARDMLRDAADRIEQGPAAAVEAVLRAIDNFEDHRRGAAGYTGPLAERVIATCRELERRVSASWEPHRALADYLIAEFGPGMVDPAVVLPEAGVDIGAPAEVALRALKYAKARGAFEVVGNPPRICVELRAGAEAADESGGPIIASIMRTAAGQIAALEAASARWVTGRPEKTAKPRKLAALREKLRRADLAMAEMAKTIEMLQAQKLALEAANASLATDAGLWAREAPKPVAGGDHGDVSFWSEQDGEVLSYQIGWLHGGGPPRENYRSQYKSREEWSARGWGLYASGDLHDGHESIADLLDVFSDGVYLSLDDYRAGRSVTIEAVIDAARAFVGLQPLAEDPAAVGPLEDDGE